MRPRGFRFPLRFIVASSVAGMIQVTAFGQTLPFTDGLLYHLDAAFGVNTDGTAVTGWEDITGNGNSFLQSDPLKQPTLVLDGIGGRPTIRFDGNTTGHADGIAPNADELILGQSTSVRTFVAVNRLAPGNPNLAGIWGVEGSDLGVRRSSGTPGTRWQGVILPANNNDFSDLTGTILVNGRSDATVAENVPHVVLSQRTANATFSATSIGDYFFATSGTTAVAPRSYKGDISEVLVFNRELSTQEQKELSVHLAAKYQAGAGGMVYNVGGVGIMGSQAFGGTEARYIRIRTEQSGLPADTASTDANRFGFHIAELEVFSAFNTPPAVDPANNLALNAHGSTFTTLVGRNGHGADSNAINGVLDASAAVWTRNPQLDLDGNIVPGPVEALLDLGTDRLVSTVRLWQRPDGVPDRLRNFTVAVEDANGEVLETFSYPGQVGQDGMQFAEFNLDITTNGFKVGARDILSLELSPLYGNGDRLLVGAEGDGVLTLEPGASLAVLNIEGAGLFTMGQSFDILDFGSVQGTFDTISLPGGQSMWDLSDLYTTGVITVVPEPSSFAMLLGASLFIGARRRSRRG